MQISAVTNIMPFRAIEPNVAASSGSESPAPLADPISLRRVAALLTMLENKPEIRPEVLARGRALAADPNYPPPIIVDKLAGLVVGDGR